MRYMRAYLWQESLAYICMLGIAAVNLLIPSETGRIVDNGIVAANRAYLASGVLLVLLLSLGRGVMVFLQSYFTETVAQGIAYDQRNQLY